MELTPELCARLQGPYARRNVYGAALAYGPVLAANPRTRPMLQAVLGYSLGENAPLLRELIPDFAPPARDVRIRYEPREGSELQDLPTVLSAVPADGETKDSTP